MLRKVTIAKDKFVEIMTNYYPNLIKNVESPVEFKTVYCNGYVKKSYIYYHYNTAIMPADVLLKYGVKVSHPYQAYNYQLIVECGNDNNVKPITFDYTGSQAFNILKNKILKYVPEAEFWSRLESFKTQKDDRPIMIHDMVKAPNLDTVVCYQHTSSVDINSAYGYLIMSKVFPEARPAFEYYYSHRKNKPQYKQLFTHFHGFAKSIGYESFYWYIVHECRAIIDDTISKLGGKVIYANTDGVKIQYADVTKVNIDNKIGAFKLEYFDEDCYVYYGSNYSIVQMRTGEDKDMTGNCLKEVRQYMDLSLGNVVRYNKVKLFPEAKKSPWIAQNIEKYNVGVLYE